MIDTATSDAGQSPAEAVADGTETALESFVSRTQLQARYLGLALVLAGGWWLVEGPTALVAGLGFVTLVFGLQGLVGAVRSWRWPETEAVVVSSEVLTEREAREYAGLDDVDGAWSTQEFSGGYVPAVRYEFTVDGQRFRNAAISPFDDSLSRRKWAKALVDKYPENGTVSLRYDPDDPTRSYLRSWIRSTAGIVPAAGIVFLAAATWIAVGTPGGAPVVAFAAGLPGLAVGLRRVVVGLRSHRWPTTTGTVTATGVDARSSGGDEGGGTVYVPGLQYEYSTDGTSYVSTRYGISPDSEPSFDSRKEALSWLEDSYPLDAEVTVHYDPGRPGRAVLVPGASGSVPLVLFGLVFTALGVVFLLFPSGVTL